MKEPLKVTINDKYANAYLNRIIILLNCWSINKIIEDSNDFNR